MSVKCLKCSKLLLLVKSENRKRCLTNFDLDWHNVVKANIQTCTGFWVNLLLRRKKKNLPVLIQILLAWHLLALVNYFWKAFHSTIAQFFTFKHFENAYEIHLRFIYFIFSHSCHHNSFTLTEVGFCIVPKFKTLMVYHVHDYCGDHLRSWKVLYHKMCTFVIFAI